MIIYRVEHPRSKKGPYNSKSISWDWQTGNHNKSRNKHPTPDLDFKKKDSQEFFSKKNYIFGFKSLKQLKNWFNNRELKRLESKGCKIYKIKIDGRSKVLLGKRQLAFKREYILEKEILI